MWPFKSKTLPVPYQPVEHQLKSLTLPQANPSWKLYAKMQLDWRPEVAIAEGYNASAIVYACVEKRAKLLASAPWKVQTKSGDDWEDQPNHLLQKLIDSPNPDESWYELMYEVSQSLDLAGNAFISEIKAGIQGRPVELWHLPAQYMRIKPGTERMVDYFEYTDHAIRGRRIQSVDMIQLKMPNPGDRYFGMPVLMAAGRATDIDRESGIWQKTSLENRGSSDVNIKLPPEATQEQVDQVKQAYKDQQSGAKNARKAMVTNAEIQQLGQTAVEMDFVNSRRAIWTEICAVFGMSLANLGMTENVNLANAEAMDKALWMNTVIPQLDLIKRQLNHQLASEFGADVRLVYDLSNVEALQDGLDKKLSNAKSAFDMGVPFNEINQKYELGFDDIEGGDVGYLAAGLMPVGFQPMDLGFDDEEKQMIKAMAYGTDNRP
jgi:HK97 family phage portal protein